MEQNFDLRQTFIHMLIEHTRRMNRNFQHSGVNIYKGSLMTIYVITHYTVYSTPVNAWENTTFHYVKWTEKYTVLLVLLRQLIVCLVCLLIVSESTGPDVGHGVRLS